MKLVQTVVQKTFFVKVGNKIYCVDYLNSDKHTIGLLNRNNWEFYDEDHNDLDIYTFYEDDKKRFKEVKNNRLLTDKLISFCKRKFDEYKPLKAAH